MTAPTLLHELLDAAATAHPEAAAVGHGADVVTYEQVLRQSRRLGGWLTEHRVGRGDRVVVALPPDVVLPPLLYACSRLGAVFVVVRAQAPEPVLAHVLDDAEPVLLLADAPAARALAESRRIGCRGLDEVRRAADGSAEPSSIAGPLAVDPVCFVYTSGSTGLPNAVVCTHMQVTFAAQAIQSQLMYRRDDVVYSPLPLSFDYGLYQIFLCTLAGARLQLATGGDAGRLLATELCRVGATVLPAVPPLAMNLAKLLTRPGTPVPPLRLLTNTGSAMPPGSLATLRAHLPNLRVRLMFGLTECKRATIMPEDEDLHRPGACGRPLPGTEVIAVDDEGGRLPPGEVGELVVSGPHVMAGYWRRPELTERRFHRVHGLFPQLHTGDYGTLDEDGYVYFLGRRDDLYKERAFRVSAAEVEAATYRVPGVEAASVVPPGSGRDGATLVVVSALTPHEVLRGLRRQLEEEKTPARCVVVPRLPLNGHGKVDRAALARLAASDADG